MDQRANEQPNNRDPRAGLLLGLCIGVALGISLGVALDSIPIGIAIGAGVGVSLGIAFSGRRQEPSKPMTIAGILLVAVGIVVLAVVMHLIFPQWWCDYPVLNLIPGC
jgi:multidrug transporter EmrE-like cation transporter